MTGLSTFLTDMGTAVEGLFGTISQWFDFVTEEPALFVVVIAIPVCFFGVRIVQRLFNLN